jgi:hypothetical protein
MTPTLEQVRAALPWGVWWCDEPLRARGEQPRWVSVYGELEARALADSCDSYLTPEQVHERIENCELC